MPQKKKSNRKLSVGYTEKSHKNDKVMTRSQGINRRTSFQQDDSDRRHRRYKLIRKPLYMFTNLADKTSFTFYLKSVRGGYANVGRYSISELHVNDVTDDKLFRSNIDLLTTSDGYRVLQ